MQHVYKIVDNLQELMLFQDSLTSLKIAQTKFSTSGDVMDRIAGDIEGKEILVPLTGSVSFYGYICYKFV